MTLINKNTDYAVKTLIHMARPNSEITSVSELTKSLDIPRPFLRKIMQILNKERIVNSYKGKGGGFQLALPSERIFLTDLIKIFQGPVKLSKCIFKGKICPDIKTCPLKKKIDALEKYVISELKSISIASLLNEEPLSHKE